MSTPPFSPKVVSPQPFQYYFFFIKTMGIFPEKRGKNTHCPALVIGAVSYCNYQSISAQFIQRKNWKENER